MKAAVEYLNKNKRVLIIIILLVALTALAIFIFGGGNQTATPTVAKSESEIKLTNILSGIEGVGETEVMITEDGQKTVGIIIVCEGANNLMTRNDVLNAVSTAFKVEKSNIAIYAMNK